MEDQRFPITLRLIGVMHKEKKKMYMISVLWSDQNEIVVHRTLEDFEKMHKQLKKKFPPASKLKKSDRIIPKFRDKKAKGRGQKNGPAKSLLRLKCLQKYCNELLGCDPRVTQSAELIQFFHPGDQELQTDFSKNSIIIMPSEDEINSNMGSGSRPGNVTQPFVTETYRCVAPYDTKDTKNKPFKVAVDEKLDVLIKDKAGWWLVENEEKRMAWFPAPYLEKMEEDDDDEDDIVGIPERGSLYTAVKNYKATKVDEVTISIGAVVEVLQQSENGWWLIRYNNKVGYIPSMYLKPFNYPQIRMGARHQESRPAVSLQPPTPSLGLQSRQLSHSQENLQQLPPVSPSTPHQLQRNSKKMSRSLDILSEAPAQPAAGTAAAATATPPLAEKHAPPPTIMVGMDEGEGQRGRSQTEVSEESFISDFSSSDDSSFSSGGLSLNLSHSANEDLLRYSRTPPPKVNHLLSPATGQEGTMTPSVSEPTLYKGPTTPKVPPRPQAQEILSRCTTITRKNAARGSPSPTTIQSR